MNKMLEDRVISKVKNGEKKKSNPLTKEIMREQVLYPKFNRQTGWV